MQIISVINQKGGVGKTTTVINLAAGLSQQNKKILVVDLDPQGNATTGLGLSNMENSSDTIYDVLNGTKEIVEVIKQTQFENLDIITSGTIPPNPSEILASSHMENLMNELRKDYDVILMDAPPLLAVTDAFVCMKYSDQFILVVRSGVTELSGLERSLVQIEHANTKLSGVVVNAVDQNNSYYYGYYYNYYQYYYGDEK